MGKGGSGNESMFSFRKVEYLEEVYIGRNIQLTGGDGDLFYSLRGLKKVNFGDACTEVPDGWFSQCTGLDYSCEALEEITCLAPVPPTCGNKNVFRYVDTSKCKLLVPQGSINAYKAAEVWKDFFNIETDLNGISSDAEASAEWFDLRGRSINAPRKGLNIIRQGGKTQKVIVR